MIEMADSPPGHPARRKEIVDAARSIAASQGWPAVTVRAIAARIGCSAPAIYQYFRDKDAVLTALASEAAESLDTHLFQAISDVHGPAKKLRAAILAFWDFAQRNRELYAVIYGLDGLKPFSPLKGGASQVLHQIARELVEKHDSKDDPQILADRVAATAHGFTALTLNDRFPGGSDRALDLLLATIDDIAKSLK